MIIAHNPNELIAIVDGNDNIIGKYPRKNHAEGRLHRETSVLIINSKNEILIQRRSNNNLLDYSASGHFPFNEGYLEGAIREVQEELGMNIPKSKFLKISKHRIDYTAKHTNKRFITLWEVKGDYKISDINIDPEEVKSVEYLSVPKIKQIILNKPETMSAGFIESLKIYFRKKHL